MEREFSMIISPIVTLCAAMKDGFNYPFYVIVVVHAGTWGIMTTVFFGLTADNICFLEFYLNVPRLECYVSLNMPLCLQVFDYADITRWRNLFFGTKDIDIPAEMGTRSHRHHSFVATRASRGPSGVTKLSLSLTD
jgi:hypothetical protein